MKPLDVVIRDRIAPVLVPAGFRRRGRRFSLESELGDRAFVDVRPFRLGQRDAEFQIDLYVQPKIWRDWLTRDGRGDTIHGLWALRLRPNPSNGRTVWAFDLNDEAAGAHLSEVLTAALPGFLQYLNMETLLAYAHETSGSVGNLVPGPVPMPLLLAIRGPSEELEERLTALRNLDRDDLKGFDTRAFVTFVRAWMAENAPR